tara:strand:- start:900 stop:1064 length:165 start_codon:yes stop_codon:yes gene_type:complete
MAREYTDKLLDLVKEGVLDKDTVITACVKYMSEHDVQDMCLSNMFFYNPEDENE